jgi:tetratricopeptide (TPR) repeat protein
MLVMVVGAGCATVEPDRVREYRTDAAHLANKNDYKGALETYEAALKLAPRDSDIYYQIGRCQEKLGNHPRAETAYKTCLEITPGNIPARHALVGLLVNDQRRDEAHRQVNAWLTSNPGNAEALAEDGYLASDPREVLALTSLGQVYERLSRPDRALALYERSLSARPDQPEVRVAVERLKAQGVSQPRPD